MAAHLRCCVSLMTALVALAVAAACGSSSPPTPSPGPGNGESITGRERLGWDQPAPDAVELATFRYAIYVDGARSEIADASCATSTGTGGFPCSGRLPTMTNGAHTLELAAFTDTPGTGLVESVRSAPLRVTVNGVSAGQTSTIADGDLVTTADGLRLRVDVLHDGLVEPSTLAIAGDGRVFVGSRSGEVAIVDGTGATESLPAGAGAILSIALSPTFARDRFVYLTQADSASGDFRTARYRELRGRLGERMVVLQNGPASAEPAAVLRFGPDARLYAAFDDGDSNDAASRMSEWSGKVLRMEPDGRTPDDQA
ncbi:MAG: PQQ-dependent sugar dehydrogenase, partial [Acidobacteria bacterium]|nr:PQQ-dependent sugar dehydrogenase [Acidobacteriota bacterium]